MTPYTLKYSKRKTIGIYIKDGEVEVRAPLKTSKLEIDRIVASKERWIVEKLAESKERLSSREGFRLDYGDLVSYAGGRYPILSMDGNRAGFDGKGFYMPPGLTPNRIKGCCIRIYRMLAKDVLTVKVAEFSKRMSVDPDTVKINGAKTRWASCSSKKSLNFSWRLMMADEDVMDYVVVHELAHLTEMNHSAKFWAIVEAAMPDYRLRQKKLKELQQRLANEDWESNPF